MILAKDVGDISDVFYENIDLVIFENLLNVLGNGNCAAFVGAGISKISGYPLTNELIEY